MANWSNIRLVALGPEGDVASLRRLARPYLAEARKPPQWMRRSPGKPFDPPDPLFRPDMMHGEGSDLFVLGPAERLSGHLMRDTYCFQGRNDDGVEHFCEVSTRFPNLRFVVVWADPNGDWFGSAYVRNGRATRYELGSRRRSAIYNHWRRKCGASLDDDDWYAWDAYSEMMDVAQRRWETFILPRKKRRRSGRQRSQSARR